jgi:CRISPR type III-A-associated protein Csm2
MPNSDLQPKPGRNFQSDQRRDEKGHASAIVKEISQHIGEKSMSFFEPDVFAVRKGYAERFIQALYEDKDLNDKKDLNSTQLRRVFGQIKALQKEFKVLPDDAPIRRTEIALLNAQLAYALGRGLIPNAFFELLTFCIDTKRCVTKKDFENVATFLEAILAYHKYYSTIKRGDKE